MKSPRKAAMGLSLALISFALVACGDGNNSAASNGGEIPAEYALDLVLDVTGVSEPYNVATKKGWDLRIEQANENGDLGETELTTELHDSRSDPKVGARLMAEVAASDAPIAVFGTTSSVAPAVAPVAQRAGLPLVTMYSGGAGVVDVGDNIFRVTAPQSSYHQLQSEYFAANGVEKVAVIYNNDNATLKGLAEDFYPEAAATDGYEIVKSSGVSYTATDLSAEMTGILGSEPDAVLMLVLGQQNTSVVTQLRRGGFDGIIGAQPAVGKQTLAALGADADGVVYPLDFAAVTDTPSGTAFVDAYREKYDEDPDTFAAAGYDGATMAILAMQKASSFDRESIRAALQDLSEEGFDSASGPLKFEERDARVEGLMVEWRDGKEGLAE